MSLTALPLTLPFATSTGAVARAAEQAVPDSVEQDVAQSAEAAAAAFGLEWGTVVAVGGAFLTAGLTAWLLFVLARVVLARRPVLQEQARLLTVPVSLAVAFGAARVALGVMAEGQTWHRPAAFLLLLALVGSAAWAAWRLAAVVEGRILRRYQEAGVNDRRERKIRTQTMLLRRILNAVIVVLALAAVLLAVPEVRSLGAGLLASAGLISVVAGLAVQSTLTNVFAGVQLAFTDSIRVGDVVDMQGVFGTVEEITLSNVVVKLWDGRRMVYPSSHFTTQPFENWTRVGSAVAGVVEMDVDWRVPMDALRDRLTMLLESTELWDGEENAMQVTDAVGGMVRVRAVVSARTSGELWDLRCLVREDFVSFLRTEFPEGIYTQRLVETERTPAAPVEVRSRRSEPVTAPLAQAGGHASMYTGSIRAVERNRELAGPGEDAFAERRAQQRARQEAEAARDAQERAGSSRAGAHAARPDQPDAGPAGVGDGRG